jgi:hypothetical protein
MKLKLLLEKKPLLALLGAAVLGIGGVTMLLVHASSASQPNLITMLQDLGGTTGDMLANTQALQGEVQGVQNKLGELNAQEAILQQQIKTGAELQQKLAEQEQLTTNGVALMEQILQREQTAVQSTASLAQLAQTMTPDVQQNAATLHQLSTALGVAAEQSHKLNAQMDALLAELAKSKDSFQLFGTVNDILQHPLDLQNTLNRLNDLLHGSSGTGSSNHPLGTLTDPVGGLLGTPSGLLGNPSGAAQPNTNPAPSGSLLELLP